MDNPQQLKSILKKPAYPATTVSKEQRNQELALYHANILQERKQIELEILLSTETLIDYPLANATYSAANPSATDADSFKSLLRPFQPSDYDALILERNINNHCGYALCPNENLKETGGGKYRILGMNGRAKDFRVVEKEELEKWCSQACAKRALYVRVQLSESPAWERGASEYRTKIDLLDEPQSDEMFATNEFQKLDLGNDEAQSKDRALALERGDQGFAAKSGLVDVNVRENRVERPAEAPSLETRLGDLHLTLEGYTPTFDSTRDLMDRDEEDTDFKL